MLLKDKNTISLLHFNDENNLNKDECGNNWIIKGNLEIERVNTPSISNTAVYFDGNSQMYSNEVSNQISTSVYTIEFFSFISEPKTYVHTFFSTINSLTSNNATDNWINSSVWNGDFRLCFYGNQIVTSIPIELYKWNHIAVTYDLTTYNVFLNGQLCITGDKKQQISGELSLGNVHTPSPNSTRGENLIGYMSEFRVSNIIRYFENFDIDDIDNDKRNLKLNTERFVLNNEQLLYRNIRACRFS